MIFTETVESHLILLEKLFVRLQDVGLTISIKKSCFLKNRLRYLGQFISSTGISPDSEKIDKLPEWQVPSSSKQVRSFLGFCSYFRSFIPRFAEISKCLYELTSDKIKFVWSDVHENAFKLLKDKLLESQELRFPDFSKPFFVAADASKVAMGAALLQKDDHKRLVPIEFASGLFNTSQLKYSTTDKEALAIDFALKKFRYSVFGYDINVLTDHKPLLSIFNSKELNLYPLRMVRLILRVQSYNPKLIFVKGRDNQLADFLSRLSDLKANDNVSLMDLSVNLNDNSNSKVINTFDLEDLKVHQSKDRIISNIIKKLNNNESLGNDVIITGKDYVIVADVLYIRDMDNLGDMRYRIVLPECLEYDVMSSLHHSFPFIHLGIDKTKKSICVPS